MILKRIKSFLIWCFLFTTTMQTNAQILRGQVVDFISHRPIAYVNIGVIGRSIGTVSDSNGNFDLSLSNVSNTDTLRISMMGYHPEDFLIGNIQMSNDFLEIHLSERVIELNEVIVKSKASNNIVLGIRKKSCYPIPLYRGASTRLRLPSNDLGQEIGTFFSNKDRTLKLDSVQLNFAKCIYDSVTFRLNIYKVAETGINYILKHSTYVTLSKHQILNSPKIDLSKKDVFIDTNFTVSIENIKNAGGLGLYFLANFKSKGRDYPTIFRRSSQGIWQVLKHKSKSAGISILVYAH